MKVKVILKENPKMCPPYGGRLTKLEPSCPFFFQFDWSQKEKKGKKKKEKRKKEGVSFLAASRDPPRSIC